MADNAYTRMMAGMNDVDISAVDIMGEPTDKVPSLARRGAYTDRAYGDEDQVDFGFDSAQHPQATVNAAGAVLAGATALLRVQVSSPFKPVDFQVESSVALWFNIQSLKIGPIILVEGDPIPASKYSEVSLYAHVDWPTLQTSQLVEMTVTNIGALPHRFRASIKGKRVR
jgi:hypothetical protein